MQKPAEAPRRILIVDDEENVCHALRRSLRKEGYELFFGNEPAQGLEVLKAQPVDMVISDHLMPNMTGLEFLKLVRNRYPDVMRIMLIVETFETGQASMNFHDTGAAGANMQTVDILRAEKEIRHQSLQFGKSIMTRIRLYVFHLLTTRVIPLPD